jgi:hypothetical protein
LGFASNVASQTSLTTNEEDEIMGKSNDKTVNPIIAILICFWAFCSGFAKAMKKSGHY